MISGIPRSFSVTIQEQKKLLQGLAAGEKSANGQEEANGSSASTAANETTGPAPVIDSRHEGNENV
jgi:hypothetical protein